MRDPVWDIMDDQGRSLRWLADVTGFSRDHVAHVACGDRPATAAFRAACSRALHIRESLLFLPLNYDGRSDATTVARAQEAAAP